MKKLLLFSVLVSLALFTACSNQELEADFVPANQESSASSTIDKANSFDTDNTFNDVRADFTINHENSQVHENEALLLTNKSVNAVSYAWDFGNGDLSTEAQPAYKYKIHGNYTVTLTITDARGNAQVASQELTVLCIYGGGDHDQ